MRPSEVLQSLRAGEDYLDISRLRIRLADAFGYCQGVEAAVRQAMRAAEERAALPERERPRLMITGEIIHNPSTNARLHAAGVALIAPGDPEVRFADITERDWVIIPAFGILAEEEALLRASGCRLIDTTCGWVRRIWQAVRAFSQDHHTVVIHGKAEHEETRATASRVAGPYIVVRNRSQAIELAQILTADARWDARFAERCSAGFDPTRDLRRMGLVNQTTMLSSETEEIAAILARATATRDSGAGSFRSLDTFCPATQRRQDAVRHLLASSQLDGMIVVGGFRSSNTAHLARLGAEQVPCYHVEDADCLLSLTSIRHLPPSTRDPIITQDWMIPAPCTLGLTSGASTPDSETNRTLARLLELYREAAS